MPWRSSYDIEIAGALCKARWRNHWRAQRLAGGSCAQGQGGCSGDSEGRSGHSSRPDLGVNAIHVMTRVMAKAVAEAERLTQGPFEETFAPLIPPCRSAGWEGTGA